MRLRKSLCTLLSISLVISSCATKMSRQENPATEAVAQSGETSDPSEPMPSISPEQIEKIVILRKPGLGLAEDGPETDLKNSKWLTPEVIIPALATVGIVVAGGLAHQVMKKSPRTGANTQGKEGPAAARESNPTATPRETVPNQPAAQGEAGHPASYELVKYSPKKYELISSSGKKFTLKVDEVAGVAEIGVPQDGKVFVLPTAALKAFTELNKIYKNPEIKTVRGNAQIFQFTVSDKNYRVIRTAAGQIFITHQPLLIGN